MKNIDELIADADWPKRTDDMLDTVLSKQDEEPEDGRPETAGATSDE